MTNGTITVRNSYNPDGARIAKIVNRSNGSETFRYTYNGGKLVYDIIRINKEGVISNLTILMSYDESGRPFMITYANVSYYYLLNAQGDVVGIMNVSGDIMVEYTYDAWGNVLSITGPMASTMGQHNQLRYRGYVYDPETGLYFLNSRFYDPEIGRFINADALTSTGGLLGNNMFAYCRNNPVNRIDIRGYADTAIEEEFDDDIEPHPHLPEGGGYAGGTTPIAGTPGGGYAYAYNPIDAAYHYSVDTSQAANSSSFGGGLYTNGYTENINYSDPNASDPSQQSLLPMDYYTGKKAPKFSTPYSSYTNYKYNVHTGEWEKSTAYYDYAGRQVLRIDWTNHGRSDHGNPHVHRVYFSDIYRDGIAKRVN